MSYYFSKDGRYIFLSLLAGPNAALAKIEVNTGRIVWEKHFNNQINIAGSKGIVLVALDYFFIKFDQGDKQTIDYRVLRVLNDEYAVINDLKYQKPSGFGLYSLDKHKVLWKKEAQFKSAVIEEDILYYYTDDKVSAVELKTGKEIWSAPFVTQNEQKGWKKPVIIKDKLVIATFRDIFAFDKKSGEFVYRVSDFSVGEAEARFYENTFEMLTRIGDELYIGSDTDCFNKLKIE